MWILIAYLASYLDSSGFHDFRLPYSCVVVEEDHLVVASFAVLDELFTNIDSHYHLISAQLIVWMYLPSGLLPIGLFRLFRLFIGGHIWPLFFMTCGFWLIGLPIGAFIFIALSGLLPMRAPGFGARFGEFIPRCGLELPIDWMATKQLQTICIKGQSMMIIKLMNKIECIEAMQRKKNN